MGGRGNDTRWGIEWEGKEKRGGAAIVGYMCMSGGVLYDQRSQVGFGSG